MTAQAHEDPLVTEAAVVRRMSPEDRTLFDVLPIDVQSAYLSFWFQRPDQHASHRDTLPAFVAGAFVGMRR